MTTSEVWSFLRVVRSLRFEATSEAATGWDGVGVGTVTVVQPSEGVLLFEEAGVWTSTAGRESEFTNVFRWSLREDTLRLEHLRHGPDQPVFLFDMASDTAGHWRDIRPHVCRDDCYSASLTMDGRGMNVTWSIQGPKKRETIRYQYS